MREKEGIRGPEDGRAGVAARHEALGLFPASAGFPGLRFVALDLGFKGHGLILAGLQGFGPVAPDVARFDCRAIPSAGLVGLA